MKKTNPRKEYFKEYYKDIKGICNRAMGTARKRVKKNNLEITITSKYLYKIYPKNGNCPILGYKMVPGKRVSHKYTPTLDRVNPSRGYVKGNVIFICQLANQMKSEANYDELLKFSRWIIKNKHPLSRRINNKTK